MKYSFEMASASLFFGEFVSSILFCLVLDLLVRLSTPSRRRFARLLLAKSPEFGYFE